MRIELEGCRGDWKTLKEVTLGWAGRAEPPRSQGQEGCTCGRGSSSRNILSGDGDRAAGTCKILIS
jgi:hypothetical protein